MPGPVLVELMGPPGAGKSTVFQALLRLGDRLLTMPALRRRLAPGLVLHAATTVATLARRRALGTHWNRDMLLMTAQLRALPPVLEGRRRPAGDVLVFDQGPMFTLTRPHLLDPRLRGWWEASFAAWRSRLDVAVWLDAPDAELVQRIEGRAKAHRVKGAGEASAREWLAADRAVFEPVLARLAEGDGGPTVMRFDTSSRSPDRVAAEVLAAIRTR